jgi:alkylation response protein AidB-like acyl-CoA dehydrogenase
VDFKFSEDEERRRKEFFDVCRELDKGKPKGFLGMEAMWDSEEGMAYDRRCRREFAKRGWMRLGWPAEYNGIGTMLDRVFLSEARGYYSIPFGNIFNETMVAPTLIAVGNEELIKRFLPPIANDEVTWCILWSEPNAGSDLANVQTTAIRKGNEYILNGQKTWTSGAHCADWGVGLFKSDLEARKHHNLSFLTLDMKTSGITIRPLYFFNGEHFYNEVFFDDVHVPVENLVGQENDGWQVTELMAGFERSNIASIAGQQRQLDDLIKYCNETKVGGKLLAHDPIIRNRLAEIACGIEALRDLAYHVADLQTKKQMAFFDAAAIKVFSGELGERIAFAGADIMGSYGQVEDSKWAAQEGRWEAAYQSCLIMTIAMGTNEIQKNVIAWYGLGMPRPPRPVKK